MEREMNHIELKISPNTTGEYSSDNPTIRFVRSRFGAMLLLFVSLLYPFESFSANCQLKSPPICLDATPCKDTVTANGTPMKTCLSTANSPAGALVTAATCWNYKSVYDCVNVSSPTYSDNCAASPMTSPDPASPNFLSTTVDATGVASFSITLPPACFVATVPPIQNLWNGNVTMQNYGSIGVINAIW